MRLHAPLCAMLAVLRSHVAAQADAEFLISRMETHSPTTHSHRGNDPNVTVSLTVTDTHPLAKNETTICGAEWPSNTTGYPRNYVRCEGRNWGWYISAFTNASDFSFELSHVFHDPSVGDPPWDAVTLFGRAEVSCANLTCTAGESGQLDCHLPVSSVLHVPIYGASAKE